MVEVSERVRVMYNRPWSRLELVLPHEKTEWLSTSRKSSLTGSHPGRLAVPAPRLLASRTRN